MYCNEDLGLGFAILGVKILFYWYWIAWVEANFCFFFLLICCCFFFFKYLPLHQLRGRNLFFCLKLAKLIEKVKGDKRPKLISYFQVSYCPSCRLLSTGVTPGGKWNLPKGIKFVCVFYHEYFCQSWVILWVMCNLMVRAEWLCEWTVCLATGSNGYFFDAGKVR